MKKVLSLSALGGLITVIALLTSLLLASGVLAQATSTPSSPVATPTETVAPTAAATATTAPTVAATTAPAATASPVGLPPTGGESSPVGWMLLAGLGALVVFTGVAMRRAKLAK